MLHTLQNRVPMGKAAKRTLVRVLSPWSRMVRPGAVAMIHAGRCGSTVVGDMLNRRPDVYWDAEIFTREVEDVGGMRRTREPGSAILARRMDYGLNRWYGFELKAHPLQSLAKCGFSMDSFLDHAEAAGVTHYVQLERLNALRRLVSVVRARGSGVFHTQRSGGGVQGIHLDVQAVPLGHIEVPLLEYMEQMQWANQRWRALLGPRNALQLTYEEHIEHDPGVAYRAIADHLGLPEHKATPRLTRTSGHPLAVLVENLDEVEATLQGTPYHWMVDT